MFANGFLFKRRQPTMKSYGQSKQPHLINTHKGFVIDTGNALAFTPDSRLASVFPDFVTADKFAKEVVVPALHYKRAYFSILVSA